jgi:hypothetical protein
MGKIVAGYLEECRLEGGDAASSMYVYLPKNAPTAAPVNPPKVAVRSHVKT